MQILDATHRIGEPVSKSTLNFCPGVPISIGIVSSTFEMKVIFPDELALRRKLLESGP